MYRRESVRRVVFLWGYEGIFLWWGGEGVVRERGRRSRSLRTKCADLMILRSKIITFVWASPKQKAASPPPDKHNTLSEPTTFPVQQFPTTKNIQTTLPFLHTLTISDKFHLQFLCNTLKIKKSCQK